MDSSVGFKVLATVQLALVFLSMEHCIAVVLHTTAALGPDRQFLRVNSTIPSFPDDVAAVMNSGPLEMRLCSYDDTIPLVEDITASAVDWGCYAVEKGIRTIPVAVNWMQESSTDLWRRLRVNCGCKYILYSVPYLRFEQPTRTWVYSTRKLPVGTSCPDYESQLCRNMFKSS